MRDVIDTCLELGIKYSVITTLITKNEEILKYIARTAYRIHVSIDSSSRALYTFIRGVDGLPTAMQNLELVQGIRNQYKNMIPVRVSMTVGNLNYQEVYKMYQNVVVKNGCLLNYYMLHTWDDLKINEEERKLLEYNLGKVAKEDEPGKTNAKSLLFNLEPNHKGSGCKCYLPYINATINANGDIYPCCKLLDDNGDYGKQLKYAYGNVADKTEEEIAKEFDKRLDLHYPQSVICRECAQRYDGMISDLEKVFDKSKREVVFL